MKSTACILVFFAVFASSFASCPSACKCPSPDFVDCSKAGLTAIPSLPSTTLNLDLSNNQLSSVPSKAFAAAAQLRFLSLANNRLSSLSPEAFAGVPNLQNLSLANNELPDAFDVSSISASNSLLDVNLANNQLTKIPALKTTSLRRLTLSGNRIRSAAFPASFSSCYDLKSVVLSGNQISGIAAKDFDSLTSLSVASLNFDSNRITSIEPKALTAVGLSLNNLSLNRNRLTTAALASALKGFQEVPSIALATLSVCSNAITKFDGSVLAPLEYTLFNSLQMDGHRMLELDPKAFQNVWQSLKILSLRDCGLSSLPAAISSLSRLETLRLDGNSFSSLPSDLPPSLLDLSMTRTDLEGWSDDALSRLSSLERLDLSNNNLETVTDKDSNPLHSSAGRLKLLSLTENPFNCSCDLAWFVKWAGSKAGKAVQAFKTLKCTSPERVAGMLLKDVDMSKCGTDQNASDEDASRDHDHKKKRRSDEHPSDSHHHERKPSHGQKKSHEHPSDSHHHERKPSHGQKKKPKTSKSKHSEKKHHHTHKRKPKTSKSKHSEKKHHHTHKRQHGHGHHKGEL